MGGQLQKQLRVELARVGEPVRAQAEQLALGNITNIGGVWSRMRLGVTRSYVYIAPRARSRGGSPRPNLGPLLLNQAMWPAAKQHEPEVVARLEGMLDRLGAQNGFS
jgi:hypothetical protein